MAVSMPQASDAAEPTVVPSVGELFLGFMRIAAFSFGGVLPWARFVVVERRRWLSPQDFTDTLALCQLLPGPNIVNMSVAIGARFHGPLGSVSAFLGLVLLPIVVVLSLATLYRGFAHLPAVDGALAGMAAAAVGLVVAMAVKIGEPILRRHLWSTAPFMLAVFGAIALMRWPLWPVILVVAPLAIGAAAWSRR